ncbi:hypothetical protein CONPUDRAFT_168121 [Coniophora puteana RWD-64-598 SS2]|uniref:Uncharacterized protein n=1 Tax=Coniophora puteana (strain RWD-64-598) TaxID=741705 RepID=A0A5M3MDJ2_CONPW|nr:uncharacterized protein CONPUDRAFT_168121 [Coniophora puteana RWD-64-598 SS2]EIW77107.1 hypothetical protein CONPUDRAFT_168121 [Coniophora puteana RWD-64-598 SS2]
MFNTQRAGPSRVALQTPSEKVKKEWRTFVTTWYSPEKTKLENALQSELDVKYKNKKSIAQKKARETERRQRVVGIKKVLAEPAREQWEQRLQRARLREEEWAMTSAEQEEVLDVFYGLFNDPEDDNGDASDGEPAGGDEEDDLAPLAQPPKETRPTPSSTTPPNGAYQVIDPAFLQTEHGPGLPHARVDPLSDTIPPPNPFSTASRSQNTSSSGFPAPAFTLWASEAALTKYTPEIPQSQLLAPERVSRQTSANSTVALYHSPSADAKKSSPHSSPPGDSSSRLATPGKRYIGPVLFDTEDDTPPMPDAELRRLKSEIDKETRHAQDAEFRRFKLDVRIRLIHEFHKEAADLEVVLVERFESQSLPKERVNTVVQEHEKQMVDLRQTLDAKRKQMCEEERQRRLKALSQLAIEGPPVPKQIEHASSSASKTKMERPRAVTVEAASDDEDDWSATKSKEQKMDDTRLNVGAASSMEILLGQRSATGPSSGSTDPPSALKKSNSSQPHSAQPLPKSAWGIKKSLSANPSPGPSKPAPPAREETSSVPAASSSKAGWTRMIWSGSNEDVTNPAPLPGNSFAQSPAPFASATQTKAPGSQLTGAGATGKPTKAGWGLTGEEGPFSASAKGKGKEKASVQEEPAWGFDAELDLAELMKNASVADDSSGTEADTPPATSASQSFFNSSNVTSASTNQPQASSGWGLPQMTSKWGLWDQSKKSSAPTPAHALSSEPEPIRELEPAPPPPPVSAKGKKGKKGQLSATTTELAPPVPPKPTLSHAPSRESTTSKGKTTNKGSKKSKKASVVDIDEETEREVLRPPPDLFHPFSSSHMPGAMFDMADDDDTATITAEDSAALARANADQPYWRNILNGGTNQPAPSSFSPIYAPPLSRDPSPPRSALETEMSEDEPESAPAPQHAFWKPSNSRESMYSDASEDDVTLRNHFVSEVFGHMMHDDDAPATFGGRPPFTGITGPSSSYASVPSTPNSFGFGYGFGGPPGMPSRPSATTVAASMGGDFATVPPFAFGGMGKKKGLPAPTKGPTPTEGWPRMAQNSGSARLF